MTAADAGRISDEDRAREVASWLDYAASGDDRDGLVLRIAAALAAERARAVVDLRAAVEELAEEWASKRFDWTTCGVAADRLRAVLDATSEQQP